MVKRAGGDLYLRVRLARHPDFEVDDHNLIYELELAPWEAVLGAEISVPTLDGRVNIKIPAGTASGQKLARARTRPRQEPAISSSSPGSLCRTRFPTRRRNCGNNSRVNPSSIRVIERSSVSAERRKFVFWINISGLLPKTATTFMKTILITGVSRGWVARWRRNSSGLATR